MTIVQRHCCLCLSFHPQCESTRLGQNRLGVIKGRIIGNIHELSYAGTACLEAAGLLENPIGLAEIEYVNTRLGELIGRAVKNVIERLPRPLPAYEELCQRVWWGIVDAKVVPKATTEAAKSAAREMVRRIVRANYATPRIPTTADADADDASPSPMIDAFIDTVSAFQRAQLEVLCGALRTANASMHAELLTLRRRVHDLESQNASLREDNLLLHGMVDLLMSAKRQRIEGPVGDALPDNYCDDVDDSEDADDSSDGGDEAMHGCAPSDPILTHSDVEIDFRASSSPPTDADADIRRAMSGALPGRRPQIGRCLRAESAMFVAAAMERLRSRSVAGLEIAPVYLGAHPQYADLRGLVATRDLRANIVRSFETMHAADYGNHPLRDFFQPDPERVHHYVPKQYTTIHTQRRQDVLQIDHLVPKSWDRGRAQYVWCTSL